MTTPGSAVAWKPFNPSDGGSVELDLPGTEAGSGPVVAIVSSADVGGGDWAPMAALRVAREWATRGERVLLADLGLERPTLHRALGLENGEGIADVFLYGLSVPRVAQRVDDGDLYFASAGTAVADPLEVKEHPRWDGLTRGFGTAGALLVLFTPAGEAGAAALVDRATSVVLLGDRDTDPEKVLGASTGKLVAFLGPPEASGAAAAAAPAGKAAASEDSLEAPAPAPDVGGGEGKEEPPGPAAPARRRRRAGKPAGRGDRSSRRLLYLVIVLVLLAVAIFVAWVGGYLQIPGLTSAGAAEPDGPEPAAVAEEPPPTVPRAEAVGTLAQYAFALEAHQDPGRAMARARQLERTLPSILFFVAPVATEGGLYHRVLAGTAPDRDAVRALRAELAGTLRGVDPEAWILRRTPLAFRLDELGNLEDARGSAEGFRSRGVPAYVLQVPYSDGSVRYRVYAGAYADAAEAGALRAALADAGLENPTLVERTGRPAG